MAPEFSPEEVIGMTMGYKREGGVRVDRVLVLGLHQQNALHTTESERASSVPS